MREAGRAPAEAVGKRRAACYRLLEAEDEGVGQPAGERDVKKRNRSDKVVHFGCGDAG